MGHMVDSLFLVWGLPTTTTKEVHTPKAFESSHNGLRGQKLLKDPPQKTLHFILEYII